MLPHTFEANEDSRKILLNSDSNPTKGDVDTLDQMLATTSYITGGSSSSFPKIAGVCMSMY